MSKHTNSSSFNKTYMEPTKLSLQLELELLDALMVLLPKRNFQSPQNCALTLALPFFLALVEAKNGYIKICTAVNFACNFMAKVREIYHAIGFRPKKEQNHLAQLGKNPTSPFVESTSKLIDSLAYLESLIAQWKEHLKMATAGPEGTVYHTSVQGFAETVKGLEAHTQSLELLEKHDVLDDLRVAVCKNRPNRCKIKKIKIPHTLPKHYPR